jgi:hypothetical protein
MAASPGRTQGMTSFTAFDIPGDKPLEYDVSLQINMTGIRGSQTSRTRQL